MTTTAQTSGSDPMTAASVIPILVYEDIEAAHDFLVASFGFGWAAAVMNGSRSCGPGLQPKDLGANAHPLIDFDPEQFLPECAVQFS